MSYSNKFTFLLLQVILLFICLFLFVKCANKSSPTGGPKDETPPTLVSSIPITGTTNFTSKIIELEFDEYVKLDKAKEQIIVTPRINGSYTLKQRRNKIIMEFDSAFAENTTYTINFRESIVDITESNPAEKLKIAFSTGSYIDSLSISGYVQLVRSGLSAQKATVSMYEAMDTSTVLDGLPYYFTETNDSGYYELENLKAGDYRVYSFQDANKNLKAESDSEPYGFLKDTLSLSKDTTKVNFLLVNLDVGPLAQISARQSGTTFDIRFNKYLIDYSLTALDSTIELQHYYTDQERKSISIYNTINIIDSLAVSLTVYDSISQELADTVYVKFAETTRKPVAFTLEISMDPIPVSNPLLSATIDFNKPIQSINKDSIYIQLDSAFLVQFDSTQITWNESNTQVKYNLTFADSLFQPSEQSPEKTAERNFNKVTPSIILGHGAFISIEGDSSSASSKALPFTQETSLATLTLNLTTNENAFFIELIDSQYEVIETKYTRRSQVTFENIPPGDYMIRAIIDDNENNTWDPGNIRSNQLPENIVYFQTRDGSKTINLRANFDVMETFEF